MTIYFDNAATTRAFPEVVKVMEDAMEVTYGNPSAKHIKGMEAENLIKEAQEIIAKTLKAKPKEIFFTSGGTESNNTAIIGTAIANHRRGKHIITSRIEHASVYEPMRFLEDQGFEITYLNVDETGHVRLDELEDALRQDTILVSLITKRTKTDQELKGLVYSLTPKPSEDGIPWYKQPAYLGGAVLAITLIMNILFW